MKQNIKARCQVVHAKKRALQRYGVKLNRETYGELVSLIQNGKARFIKRQSHRLTIFEIPWRVKIFTVVYDSIRKKIVTFLPFQ